ncbi:MAG TPA: Fe-S protein assembly co-chaperone HscB [Sulfuricella sp.]|nr:Fe-S protein assembly co-chaperone HscB [Sulfuricella sp.]
MNFDFSKNHFELFGMTPAYQIDMVRLEQAYRDIQNQVHPDKFAHLNDTERRLSMQWSTQVNEAYQTLRHPLDRARYLLHLNGLELHEETNTAMSPAFLMQQMEWREAIGEARAARDAAELEHLSGKLRAGMQAQQHQLAGLLDNDRNFEKAAEVARELKFMEKLREEINYALEALEA